MFFTLVEAMLYVMSTDVISRGQSEKFGNRTGIHVVQKPEKVNCVKS